MVSGSEEKAGRENSLKVPRVEEDQNFKDEVNLQLKSDDDISPTVDLRPRIEVEESVETGTEGGNEENERKLNPDLFPLINWNRVYFDILEYKNQKEYRNLQIDRGTLREIIEKELYRLSCPKEDISPDRFEDIERVERTVKTILRSYIKSHSIVIEKRSGKKHSYGI